MSDNNRNKIWCVFPRSKAVNQNGSSCKTGRTKKKKKKSNSYYLNKVGGFTRVAGYVENHCKTFKYFTGDDTCQPAHNDLEKRHN